MISGIVHSKPVYVPEGKELLKMTIAYTTTLYSEILTLLALHQVNSHQLPRLVGVPQLVSKRTIITVNTLLT